MKSTLVKATFVMGSEEISPESISERIGINPNLSGKKGEIVNGKMPYPDSFWEVFTKREASLDVSNQIKKIIKILKPSFQKLKDLIEEYQLTSMLLILIIIENGEAPAISLSREEIEFFNMLNSTIEIDMYTNPYNDSN